jgi:hypothetical protein
MLDFIVKLLHLLFPYSDIIHFVFLDELEEKK